MCKFNRKFYYKLFDKIMSINLSSPLEVVKGNHTYLYVLSCGSPLGVWLSWTFYLLFSLLSCAIMFGCQSKAIQMLIEPQEAINLALEKGVTCSAPEMIDGNSKTLGYADGRWIHLRLPKKKAIHQIIIRGTNITDAIIFQRLEDTERSQAVAQVQNSQSSVIEIRTTVVTNTLHIYVGGTSSDKRKTAEYSPRYGITVPQKELGKPFAHEVEIYGYIPKEKNETIDD